jgi:hypothetical protein
MERQIDLETWADLEVEIRRLRAEYGRSLIESAGSASHLLFRGQASHDWHLETTLDRARSQVSALADYYRIAAVAKTQIETFTSRTWNEIDYPTIARQLEQYDGLAFDNLPHYDFLVYLRHHGFPSPLLDWSQSPYVAAYFACNHPVGDRVALFAYQERIGVGKFGSSSEPQLRVLGPNVRSHPRHFLQQGGYTVCVQYKNNQWELGQHADVFELCREGQDRLWKLTLPRSEAVMAMSRLQEYNITTFSLFQTEEALLQSLSRSLLPTANR